MIRTALLLATAATLLSACSREGRIADGGIYVTRDPCPQVAIPAATGDITLFNPTTATTAAALDVTATMTNVRANCQRGASDLVSTVTYDILGTRRAPGPARQVVLPVFNVVMQGGERIVSKKVGQVVLNFEANSIRAQTSGSAVATVDLGAASLPADVQRELTRRRKPGAVDAAIDPLTIPAVRDAVANATFEQLVGFQLTDAQLRYNATR